VFDDRNIVRQLHAELVEKLDALEEKLDGIIDRLDAIEERLNEGSSMETSVARKPVPLPLPGDPYDISDAVSQAIRETGAMSYADMGRVIKAARGHLQRKGKRFLESDLESAVHQIDLFQRKPISNSGS
jgi:hypothetical protein